MVRVTHLLNDFRFRKFLPSVLLHCWLGHLTGKTRPRYDL